MPKTRAELITQALMNLGVIAEGQSVSEQDVTRMDRIVDGAVEELAGLEIYYIADPGTLGPSDGNIEDAAFLLIADYLASRAASTFNLPADVKLQALGTIAEGKLLKLAAPQRTRRTLKLDGALTVGRYSYYRGGF